MLCHVRIFDESSSVVIGRELGECHRSFTSARSRSICVTINHFVQDVMLCKLVLLAGTYTTTNTPP